jgi:ElaA protein
VPTQTTQTAASGRLEFRVASFADLPARTLHDLLRLRVDVFVVEQECAYPEIDGRDVEPGTRHLWFARDGRPVAYLRLLAEPDGAGEPGGVARIGRVVVARDARGQGLAARLMTEALTVVGSRPCVLAAQSHLVGFYARFGFTPSGPEYVEDGIPHVPMRRDPVVGSADRSGA